MTRVLGFVVRAIMAGLIILAPIYLTMLLLDKAALSLAGVLRPLTRLLPAWLPAEHTLSVLLVLLACFLVGVAVRASQGRRFVRRMETAVCARFPFYGLLRSLTRQVAGTEDEQAWKPALVEIEEALVPAFITETFWDGRCAVFVPSAPTPVSGSIYILTPDRVHPLDVSFAHAVGTISRWGSGSQDLVAAMQRHNGLGHCANPAGNAPEHKGVRGHR